MKEVNYIKRSRPKNNRITYWEYHYGKQKDMYNFDIDSLKRDYEKYSKMSDKEFEKSLLNIAHFCCIVGYYKELPLKDTISDVGAVHEAIHLLSINKHTDAIDWKGSFTNLRKIFKKFKI